MSAPVHTVPTQQFLTKKTQHDPGAPPSLFTPSDYFCLFPWIKNVLRGKHFAYVGEVKQKMAEALKVLRIDEFKNYFEQWKKRSQ